MTSIRDLNKSFRKRADAMASIASGDSLMAETAQNLVQRFGEDYEDPGELIQLLQETTRMELLVASHSLNNQEVIDAVNASTSTEWKNAPELPADEALQQRVGEQFLAAPLPIDAEHILIRTEAFAPKITEHLVEGLIERGDDFNIAVGDADWRARLINAVDEAGVEGIANYLAARADWTDKSFYIGAQTGEDVTEADKEKTKIINEKTKPFADKGRTIDNYFTLTIVPTPRDAEIDQMDYDDYLKLFFELCDQPWDEVTKAQEKLIAKFDAAKELHITNDDGTDLTLNIDGFTFANSVVKKNIPGSEIFSAPHRDGVNGTLVAKGRFSPKDGEGEIIENMTLTFKDGKVVEATAEKGEELLKETLAKDEGASYVGEIGIGTNPWLKQHVLNGLLVEKIGGSFHVALGACYTYTTYDGTPVHMDNGNESKIHWDVTTMLKGHGGKMYLDGELIQENGEFLDPELAVFNKGWEAVPPSERPHYWKERLREVAREQGNGERAVG